MHDSSIIAEEITNHGEGKLTLTIISFRENEFRFRIFNPIRCHCGHPLWFVGEGERSPIHVSDNTPRLDEAIFPK